MDGNEHFTTTGIAIASPNAMHQTATKGRAMWVLAETEAPRGVVPLSRSRRQLSLAHAFSVGRFHHMHSFIFVMCIGNQLSRTRCVNLLQRGCPWTEPGGAWPDRARRTPATTWPGWQRLDSKRQRRHHQIPVGIIVMIKLHCIIVTVSTSAKRKIYAGCPTIKNW